ncbi:transposase [Streptomyces sp. NPDC015414]|uniref:transposase n=1 Tax=Streptomyces sp. NPDC015414 TaxID=3364957 RepID=UPI0037009088
MRTGCAWRQLPKDFAPWPTVYWYFCGGMTTARSGGSMTPCAVRSVRPTAAPLTECRADRLAVDPYRRDRPGHYQGIRRGQEGEGP